MKTGGYVIANVIGGAIAGGIGAGFGSDSAHPILKGAAITGVISGLAALFITAGYEAAQAPNTGRLSGPMPPPRFP
jgi:hypothetical protein